MRYASPEQIKILVDWTRDGSHTLDPTPTGDHSNYRRRGSLTALRQMIEYWDLGPAYESMRTAVSNRHISQLSDVLRTELVTQARLRGFVTPGGGEVVPLFGMQMEILVRLSWGATLEDIAGAMRLTKKAASEHTWRMRRDTGTRTTAELVAHAYRGEWLPTTYELLKTTVSQTDVFDADRVRFLGPEQ